MYGMESEKKLAFAARDGIIAFSFFNGMDTGFPWQGTSSGISWGYGVWVAKFYHTFAGVVHVLYGASWVGGGLNGM